MRRLTLPRLPPRRPALRVALWAPLLVGGLLGPSTPALAGPGALSLEALVGASDAVVLAQVTHAQALGPGTEGFPRLEITLRREALLRGQDPGASFTLHQLGGPAGPGRTLRVVGDASLTPGARFVLFLRRPAPAGPWYLVALGASAWPAQVDEATGARWIEPPEGTPLPLEALQATLGQEAAPTQP